MNSPTGPSLDRLMARLAQGDRSAFDGVYEALLPPVLRLCGGLLGDSADAADAAQLALTKIFTHASTYNEGRAALPWALAIASWECRTILKKRQRRGHVYSDPDALPSSTDPDEEHAKRELIASALRVLQTLSPLDQATLIATYWEKAGDAVGPTLRKRRERALVRLRTALKRIYGLD